MYYSTIRHITIDCSGPFLRSPYVGNVGGLLVGHLQCFRNRFQILDVILGHLSSFFKFCVSCVKSLVSLVTPKSQWKTFQLSSLTQGWHSRSTLFGRTSAGQFKNVVRPIIKAGDRIMVLFGKPQIPNIDPNWIGSRIRCPWNTADS